MFQRAVKRDAFGSKNDLLRVHQAWVFWGCRLLARLEILRAAVFLWMAPFAAPFWITDVANLRAVSAACGDFSSTLALTCLTTFLIRVLAARLRICLARFRPVDFLADFWVVKAFPPEIHKIFAAQSPRHERLPL
jgi:hypothetical protein